MAYTLTQIYNCIIIQFVSLQFTTTRIGISFVFSACKPLLILRTDSGWYLVWIDTTCRYWPTQRVRVRVCMCLRHRWSIGQIAPRSSSSFSLPLSTPLMFSYSLTWQLRDRGIPPRAPNLPALPYDISFTYQGLRALALHQPQIPRRLGCKAFTVQSSTEVRGDKVSSYTSVQGMLVARRMS